MNSDSKKEKLCLQKKKRLEKETPLEKEVRLAKNRDYKASHKLCDAERSEAEKVVARVKCNKYERK